MAITVVLPDLFPAAPLRDTARGSKAHSDTVPSSRAPDVVVFSSAPFRALAELAAAGLRQLATLVPALEQAVEGHSMEPLVRLAKAATTAARQVADGHVALLSSGPDRVAAALPGAAPARGAALEEPPQALRTLAREIGAGVATSTESRSSETLRAVARQLGATAVPPPSVGAGDQNSEPAQRWLAEANHLLHRTGDALEHASALLPPIDPALALQIVPNALAIELAAAQRQIAATAASLATAHAIPRRAPKLSRFPLETLSDGLAGATSMIGALLLLAIMSLAAGLWALSLGLLGLAATFFWVWRIGRAAQGVTLDAAR